MSAHLLLTGYSRSDRSAVIAAATETIRKCGGWVEDVHFFSNTSVNLRCSVPAPVAGQLSEQLHALRLGIRPADLLALRGAATGLSDEDELRFSLQITFVHDEPDQRMHIPNVPG